MAVRLVDLVGPVYLDMFMFLFLVVGSIVVNLDVTLEQLYIGHFLEVF